MTALVYLSGGQQNQLASDSIGGQISLTLAPESLINLSVIPNIFTTGGTIYRCVYALSTLGAANWKVHLIDTISPGTELSIGWAAQAYNTTVPAIANQNTAPAGVVFSRPLTALAGISGGDFPIPNRYRGLWLKLVVTAGTVPAGPELASLVFADETPP